VRPAVGCSDWLGCGRGIINEMKTAFVPNAGDALQLIKLIPTVVITEVRNRAGATGKSELLDLKRIVVLPLVEKVFQFGPIGDLHACVPIGKSALYGPFALPMELAL
jgi:hypothetical protein